MRWRPLTSASSPPPFAGLVLTWCSWPPAPTSHLLSVRRCTSPLPHSTPPPRRRVPGAHGHQRRALPLHVAGARAARGAAQHGRRAGEPAARRAAGRRGAHARGAAAGVGGRRPARRHAAVALHGALPAAPAGEPRLQYVAPFLLDSYWIPIGLMRCPSVKEVQVRRTPVRALSYTLMRPPRSTRPYGTRPGLATHAFCDRAQCTKRAAAAPLHAGPAETRSRAVVVARAAREDAGGAVKVPWHAVAAETPAHTHTLVFAGVCVRCCAGGVRGVH